MLTHAAIWVSDSPVQHTLTYADVCWRMLLSESRTRKYEYWRSKGWQGLICIYKYKYSREYKYGLASTNTDALKGGRGSPSCTRTNTDSQVQILTLKGGRGSSSFTTMKTPRIRTPRFSPPRACRSFFVFINKKKNHEQRGLAVLHFRCYPCTRFHFILHFLFFLLLFFKFRAGNVQKIEALMTRHPLCSMYPCTRFYFILTFIIFFIIFYAGRKCAKSKRLWRSTRFTRCSASSTTRARVRIR